MRKKHGQKFSVDPETLSLSPEKIVKLINFVCGKADEKFMFTSMLRSISLKIFYEKKT